jgi:hypothetical protein
MMMRNGLKLPPGAKTEGRGGVSLLAAYVPDGNAQELVRVLAANGVAEAVMAKLLRINLRTLKKHFRTEMADGHAIVTARMGAALVKEGFAGNVAAIRYWLGTHGGEEWRIPKNSDLLPDVFDSEGRRSGGETIHFFMPSNGRDEPEDLGTTIEGVVEDAA